MRRYFTPTVLATVMVIGFAAIVGAQFPGGGRGMQGQGMGQGMGPGMRPGMGQGRGMMGGPEMGPGRGGPMAALKLTPEQRKQIQELQGRPAGRPRDPLPAAYFLFIETEIPSPDGVTMAVRRFGFFSIASRKSGMSFPLLTTLCARKTPPVSRRGSSMSRNRL